MPVRFTIFAVALLWIAALFLLVTLATFDQPGQPDIPFVAGAGFRINGEDPSANVAVIRGERWASWAGDVANVGRLVSAPFAAPDAIVLTIDGYPEHPGESILLVRSNDEGESTRLAVGNNPTERWTPRFISVPAAWRGRMVRLVAVDNGTGASDWIGVADLRPATPFERLLGSPIRTSGLGIVFYIFAYVSLVTFLVFVFVPLPITPIASDAIMCVVTFVVLFAWRWPIFLVPTELNGDESEMIANAIKATVDLVPWRGFDGTTSGPLNSDVLALAALTGSHIGFFSARCIGLALIGGTICALYFAVRWTYAANIARVCVVPLVLLFAFNRAIDFVHYSSEHLPAFLIAAAVACGSFVARRDESDTRRAAAAVGGGVFVACTPFAKLQGTPIAIAAFLYLVAAIFVTRRRVLFELAMAFAGAMVPFIVLLGSVVVVGEWHDFVTSYILSAINYVAGGGVTWTFYFHSGVDQFTTFLEVSLGMTLLCTELLIAFGFRATKAQVVSMTAAAALVMAAFYAVYAPHKAFPHYLVFLAMPIDWLVANLLAAGYAGLRVPAVRIALLGLSAVVFVMPATLPVLTYDDRYVHAIDTNLAAGPTAVARSIAKYAAPGTRVAIWGWMPQYYVETRTVMATRDAHTEHQIDPGPYQEYFRRRFLSDLSSSSPPVIVDAVAPGQFDFHDQARQGISSFPELAAFVAQRYQLVENVSGVSIFLRRGR